MNSSDDAIPILLVDDQQPNLDALQATLLATGCVCVLARSADEALVALLHQEFAAIVLDVQMPGMTGFEMARLIKRRRRTQHVPIVFLTAHLLDEQHALRAYGLGAVDYLVKPVSPAVLRAKVGVFCDLFRKRRALEQVHLALQREVTQRLRVEEELSQANQNLEQRIEERTAELRQADRRKDAFLAVLAHELRNPLAALQAAAEVLRLHTPPGSALDRSEQVILRQVHHMRRLVDDLRDMHRFGRGLPKLRLRLARVELSQILADALERSRPRIEQRQQRLVLRLPSEPIALSADAARLAQVFSDLLDHAAWSIHVGGPIELSAERVRGAVVVRVIDSGDGIEPSELPRVFELFTETERPSQASHSGLGLGLARRVIALHGGSVSARSKGPGKGAELAIRIPLRPPAEALAVAASRPERGERHFRILIVEDNVDGALTLRTLLAAWGHEIRVVHTARAAIRMTEEFRPEVVLLDIGLPDLSGHDLARKIRSEPWGKHMALIAVTGHGHEDDRQRSLSVGISHHLVKPVEPQALRAVLAKLQAA